MPPASTTIPPLSSIGTALACYFSACLHILFVGIILKTLELSERVVGSMLVLMAVAAHQPGEARCYEEREGVYGGHEQVLESMDRQDQFDERELEDDDKEDEDVIDPEKLSQLCEHTTSTDKHVSRWGIVPGSEERGNSKMEYTDNPDSPCVGQMNTSLSDIFDMSSVEYGTHMLFRPLALNGALGRTVTPAHSGDSIASDDPFLPPGLGPLALSLTPLGTFSTCIQPGSAAALSSRSRMSFATLLTNDALCSDARERDHDIKASPIELMKGRPRASRFGRETGGKENVHPPAKTNATATTDLRQIPIANLASQTGANILCDPKAIITKTKTNTPTQIYHALSTLSFWTPAPKIAVTIAPPVKRRRGGRRHDRQTNKVNESESASHDVFGERMLLQPMAEN